MTFIAARSKALLDVMTAVDRLHQAVVETGPDSTETGVAAQEAEKAHATAKRYGLTATDITLASRT